MNSRSHSTSQRIRQVLFATALTWLVVVGAAQFSLGQDCSSHELAKLLASDSTGGEEFGVAVAVSGETAVVGAYLDSHSGLNGPGSAYIYVRSNGNWAQQAKLVASDAADRVHFGSSVSVSGDTVVVGTPNDFRPSCSSCGSAYVFVRSGGVWTQRAKLTTSDAAQEDLFGYSVSVSGDTIVVSAIYDDHVNGSITNEGSAYVFVKPQAGWANMSETAKLTASDAAAGDSFGSSVAVSNDTIVIGAQTDDLTVGADAGSAYVFQKPSSGWSNKTETAKLTASDVVAHDGFGISVALSGDMAIIGAYRNDNAGGPSAGSAYVFDKPPCGWESGNETARLTASDANVGDYFGTSVSLSGDTAVIGAPVAESGETNNAGAAYVFTRSHGVWSQQSKMTASDAETADSWGYAVAVSGQTALAGAYADNNVGGAFAGSAYVFRAAGCDSDGDGVPNSEDVCPNSHAGPAVNNLGRPLRDCNQDCLFNAADIQCIVNELLSQ